MNLNNKQLIYKLKSVLDYILAHNIILDTLFSFFLIFFSYFLWKNYHLKNRLARFIFYTSVFFAFLSFIEKGINIIHISKVLRNPQELKYVCGNVDNYTYLGLPAREHFKINNIYFSFNEALLRDNVGSKEKIKNIKLAIYYVPEANNQAIKVYIVKECPSN